MFRNLKNKFIKDSEAAVGVIVGLALTTLISATGVAVDVGRAQLVQAKLSSSLDAAGLAAGATVNTVHAEDEVQKYVDANFHNYLGATVTNLTTTVGGNNSTITITATASVPTTLMQIVGHDTMTVSATSEITRQVSGLELVMVLDNTGSMNNSGKLANLKTAANTLLNILYGDDNEVDDLWVGLVPFSQAVNIGSTRSSWTTNTSFNWGPTSWAGCVDARETGGRDATDDPPSVELFPKYYWTCHSTYNPWFGRSSSKTNCNTSGTTLYNTPLSSSRGPNKQCPQAVTPLTASKSTVVSAINSMTATGNTHINLGAAWGWRMLSPRWRGLWGGEMNTNNLPLDYNTENMNKAVIIMTDGDNTMDNQNRTAYWYLSDGKLGTTNQTNAENQLDSRLSQTCTAMKNNNIIVYTVSFGTISTASQTMLRNCASQSDFYFNSPNNAALQAAFSAIGDSLSNLRVSK